MLRGKHHKEWSDFLIENPEFRSRVNNAQKILDLLRDSHDHLSDDDLLRIWKNIENFDDEKRNRNWKSRLRTVMRYAAVLIVALSVSSAGYWVFFRHQKSYVYTTATDAGPGNQSRLLLSNGTTVDIETDNSKIALNGDRKIVIDNEKTIDLGRDNPEDGSKMNEVLIPYGKKSRITLGDGTNVWLNAGTRMAFPTIFTGKERVVFLEGEAYFEVTHNQDLPFIVNAGEISVKVLGTKFNLSAYKSDLMAQTVLIEGQVVVSERTGLGFLKTETFLAPNQKASYDWGSRSMTVIDEPDVESAIAWTEGWLKFSKQDLTGVLSRIQRYYNVQFVCSPEFRTTDLITGKLDLKASVGSVMVVLADVANISYKIEGDKIYIDKKSR
jgi:transmembrane sensor